MAGGENPAHHAAFVDNGIERIAINVGSLRRNYDKAFSGDLSWLDGELVEWLAWTDTPAGLDDLIDVVERIGSMPTYVIGGDEWASHENYLPVWTGENRMPVIESHGMVVTDTVYKSPGLMRRALAARHHDRVLGAITGRPKGLERLSLAVVTSWWNPQQYGETHLWTGRELRRFRAAMKDQCRADNVEAIAALGLDVDAVLRDDPDAVTALSLRSWNTLGDHIADRATVLHLVPPDAEEQVAGALERLTEVTSGAEVERAEPRSRPAPLARATPRKRHLLPILGQDPVPAAKDGEEPTMVLRGATGGGLRRCDNCYLAAPCPEFQPGHECAFEIPVRIDTKAQLQRVLATLVEMQAQRALMARFAEEIEGQELSSAVGLEFERTFALAERWKNIDASGTGLRVLIEGSGADAGAAGGVLSRLFGPSVGANASPALERPVVTGSDGSDEPLEAQVIDEEPQGD